MGSHPVSLCAAVAFSLAATLGSDGDVKSCAVLFRHRLQPGSLKLSVQGQMYMKQHLPRDSPEHRSRGQEINSTGSGLF